MKCHSIDRGTPKRYRVVCKCKYFALNTLNSKISLSANTEKLIPLPSSH